MTTLDQVTQKLFGDNLATSVHSEGHILIVRKGTKEVRIKDWQASTLDVITSTVKGSSINESLHGNKILING